MLNQKELFDLNPDIVFLNGAYMSPQLKAVEAVGLAQLSRKNRPDSIAISDFFSPVQNLKASFATLIGADDPERIAVIPSVSYGIANAAHNLPFGNKQQVLVSEAQFPSNYYIWERLCQERGATLQVVSAPEDAVCRGDAWTEAWINAINHQTAVVALEHVHWADGSVLDLVAIAAKARSVGAAVVVDGTQSVGALPFNVAAIQPDALICAGYKWLLGPYSIGLAYYSPKFDGGKPIEENWINKKGSENFKNLVAYQSEYKPKAARYCMGEQSNFVLVPMLQKAMEQILAWGPEQIQAYCHAIASDALPRIKAYGGIIDASASRAGHLFGVRLGPDIDPALLEKVLKEHQVHLSFRGDAIRVAPHVYNTASDFDILAECFRQANKKRDQLS
jgi:selenocysteine lyase/cysteine desulfurase